MKVLIYKFQGGTARKLECMMWIFMFTEGRNAKFLTGILDFKHCRHTVDKNFSYVKQSRRFLVKSRMSLPRFLCPVNLYMDYLISEISLAHFIAVSTLLEYTCCRVVNFPHPNLDTYVANTLRQ